VLVHWFLVDETNRDYSADHFFIVGGLVIRPEQVADVDAAVREVREAAGYLAGDSFKFDTRARPAQVSIETATEAKGALLDRLESIGVRMIVYVILHDLCRTRSYDVRMNYALNTLAYAYFDLLRTESASGVMLIDRDNGRYDHLESLFQNGLDIDGRAVRIDSRIKLFGMTNDNASNLSSAADIALGAFRYCVNSAGGWGKDAVARAMFPTLARIMWGVERDDKKHLGGYGFHARPKTVRVPRYQELYAALKAGLVSYAGASD